MGCHATLGGALHDIQKTTAKETTVTLAKICFSCRAMNRTKIPLSSEGSNLLFSLLLKLENAKAEHAEERIGLEKQIAQLKDQLNKARHGLQDQASI